jgi:hypothetical protein
MLPSSLLHRFEVCNGREQSLEGIWCLSSFPYLAMLTLSMAGLAASSSRGVSDALEPGRGVFPKPARFSRCSCRRRCQVSPVFAYSVCSPDNCLVVPGWHSHKPCCRGRRRSAALDTDLMARALSCGSYSTWSRTCSTLALFLFLSSMGWLAHL